MEEYPNTMKKHLLSLLFLFLFLYQSSSQKSLQPLIDSLEQIIQENRIAGAMISIATTDTILFSGGIGYADIAEKEKATKDHLFRIGSISKGFVALGILKLESEGKMSLKDPILKIDPDLPVRNKWKVEAPITVENVLEHTAGFDDMHIHAVYNNKDEIEPASRELVYRDRKSLISRWKPGTRMSYSNPGYVLAGHLVETVSKSPYTSYIKSEILDKIGMVNSAFYFRAPANNKMAQGYYHEGGEFKEMDFVTINGGPAGSICASARDMAVYLQYVLNRKTNEGQEVIPVERFDRWENPETTLAVKRGFPGGYGLANGNSWRKGHLFHGHNGGIDGFSSHYIYSRTADLGISICMNTGGSPGVLMNPILDFLMEDEEPELDRQILPIPSEIKEKYEGFYNFKSPRLQMRAPFTQMTNGVELKFQEDTVLVNDIFGTEKDKWVYGGNGEFYVGTEGLPFAKLFQEEGKSILWLGNEYAEKGSKGIRMAKNLAIWISVLVVLSYIVIILFWMFFRLIKKRKGVVAEILPIWLACLCLVLIPNFFGTAAELVKKSGALNIASIVLFVLTFVFAGMSIFAIFRSIKLRKVKAILKTYTRLTSIGLMIILIFLLVNGYIGFRLWAY